MKFEPVIKAAVTLARRLAKLGPDPSGYELNSLVEAAHEFLKLAGEKP